MRATYATIGLVLIALVIGAWLLAPRENVSTEEVAPLLQTASTTMQTISITSSAFSQGEMIPLAYTCDGNRTLNPPLSISGVPESAKSLVLIMDDPDVPKELIPDGVFDHWVVYNIPPETREIEEGAAIGTPGANTKDDL